MLNDTFKASKYTDSEMSAANDPWEPIHSLEEYGEHRLTSVEFTVTNLCNMRCEHCAVGDSLTQQEGGKLPVELIFRRLDEIEGLRTVSLTGGEPSYSMDNVRNYIVPLLKYARDRGVRTQINSNVTLDYARYEQMAPYLDVLHISFNYLTAEDFYEIGFARTGRKTGRQAAYRLYERMMDNTMKLSEGGLFVSAESMINYRTHLSIGGIHQLIAEMGCRRHEVHPMYPSSFASDLPVLSLQQTREAIGSLLDARDPKLWMLFGTLPFYACSDNPEDRRLLKRLREEPNLSIRNDPDGRNRLNVNLFTGDVYVTDFSAVPPLGNIRQDDLPGVFDRWLSHSLFRKSNCHCPAARCCGPNLLVMDAYYKDVDFTRRRAVL